MAKFVYAMNVSLDGYVDHDHPSFEPDAALFEHFTDDVRGLAGSIHGRRMYEAMRYWDDDRPEWTEAHRDYAAAWRRQPKWVVSRTMETVGPNATLIGPDVEAQVRAVKTRVDGVVEVAGPELAASLTDFGLIDEYRLYIHPVVLGSGRPYFARPRPRLRLVSSERFGADVIRLSYVPA